jgi:hypothetical protein
MTRPRSIEKMYPRVPVEMLVADEWQRRFDEYFLESRELDSDPFQVATHTDRRQRKCVSVCVFKQNVNNQFPGQFPVDEEHWQRKYWAGLLGVVRDMACFPEWKLRIYVEYDLWDLVHGKLAEHPQVELYRMRVNSVGAAPGALWRFLALSDRSLDVVLATDIDESLKDKMDHIGSFEMDTWSSIGRIGGFASDEEYLVHPSESPVKNYATILASRVMSRPARWDFDIAAALRGFMAYRRHLATGDRPWAYSADDTPNVYNQPIDDHIYGWGSHWYMYGFDERFLKHVVYYHFAQKGGIHTWAFSLPPAQMSPEGACDLQHVRARGNTTVFPHSAVRLAKLQLTPLALRVAFFLDEYRWIFEALLHLMRQHAAGGWCGNLFFHDVNEPYLVDLVAKQVNLFEAARQASKALEIGFNAGHGSAILLLANPHLTIRAFDTCELAYVEPCLAFLNSIFGKRITLVPGRSQTTVPLDVESGYDLAHIDAEHTCAAVTADLANSLPRCVPGAIVVLDDHEAGNGVERAALARRDLVPTEAYTLRTPLPGSSHAIFRYCPPDS